MMIGGYTLDLYCDGALDCPKKESTQNSNGTSRPPAQYYGETGQECRKQAIEDGWSLSLKEGLCLCPACAKAGVKPSTLLHSEPIDSSEP